MPSLAMNEAEREAYLAETRVAVLSVARGDGRGPLALPIWYAYEPGGLVTIGTSPSLPKARLITAQGRYTITVQDDRMPYRYVSVEGPLVSSDPMPAEEWSAIAHRYFDEQTAKEFIASGVGADNIAYRMRPERWSSIDYTKA